MIILFGSNGYIGEEFAKQLKHLNKNVYYWPNTRKTTFQDLEKWYELRRYPYIDTVINAAGYTGKPNVDSCEIEKSLTVHGNIVWPQILTDWCILNDIPLGHVSSGCIYTGKKEDDTGFTEEDKPNFSWNQNNCSFYSGTKSIGEDIVSKWEKNYIWRLRIPFENVNNNRNYLSKILNYKKLLNAENSISNKQEFVSACIQLILRNSPFGIYNVTNTGYITTEQIVDKMKKTIGKNKDFEFINESLFYTNLAKTPRSNCILDNKKLLSTGIKMSDVNESIDYCLNNWIY